MQENKFNYFQFSRRERRGIYILLAGIVIVFAAPAWLHYLLPQKKYAAVPLSSLPIPVIDSSAGKPYTKKYYPKHYAGFETDDEAPEPAYDKPYTLFNFDPNTISAEAWEQLGVRPKTVQTIQNYLSKGGRFRKPGDISHIYGLGEKEVQRLLPYVRIEQNAATNNNYTEFNKESFPASFSSKNKNLMLNINTADTLQWKLLPGIGAGYARRIVNYRGKLGGFHSINQVAEVYGLPDSVFQKIKPQLEYEETDMVQININTATAETLMTHPYISKNLANLVVNYRNQHGPYKSIADLKKLALVTESIYLKISAYLTIE